MSQRAIERRSDGTGVSIPSAQPARIESPSPGEVPIAFLVDYDGTIALTDVSDTLMVEYVDADWEAKAAEYDAGRIGSRALMEWEISLITADPGRLEALAAAQPHDATFAPFVRRARALGAVVEVVSDGFGFFIAPALESLGVGDVPIVTASTTFLDGRPTIAFPNGHPACFVCGTCKRNRVLAHRAAGRVVAFVGDGESDRYAAAYADAVFAKRALVRICDEWGWPYQRWTEFAEIQAWLDGVAGRWPADPTALPRRTPPFVCGPEVWGPGRWDPPPGWNAPRDGAAGAPGPAAGIDPA